jgi:3'-5' exoribonuclease
MSEEKSVVKPIRDLKPGDPVNSFYVVRKKELKTKHDGTPYMLLELGDASGRISAIFWEDARAVYEMLPVGQIVRVLGTVATFNDGQQITVEKIRPAEPKDKIQIQDFIPKCPLDMEALVGHLEETIDSVANPYLHHLLKQVTGNAEIWKRFREAPAGKLWHHAYLGGLLEHTASLVTICQSMTELYPMLNRDLLITGAILHDIGKIQEYRFDRGLIDISENGRLLGHISIGAQMVDRFIDQMDKSGGEFPADLRQQLLHLILSHQGELVQGSPVVPMTPEAMALYYADELDSKLNALKQIVQKDREPDREWSRYMPSIERFVYLGLKDLEED